MRYILWCLLLMPLCSKPQDINIIPRPNKVELKSGFLNFQKGLNVKLYGNDAVAAEIASLFANQLFGSKQWKVPVSTVTAKNIIINLYCPRKKIGEAEAAPFL